MAKAKGKFDAQITNDRKLIRTLSGAAELTPGRLLWYGLNYAVYLYVAFKYAPPPWNFAMILLVIASLITLVLMPKTLRKTIAKYLLAAAQVEAISTMKVSTKNVDTIPGIDKTAFDAGVDFALRKVRERMAEVEELQNE